MLLKRQAISALILSVGLSTLPVLAHAELKITNNTSKYSTTMINGICSNALGSQGITPPYTTQTVKDSAINLVCSMTPNNCAADVFMTQNCGDPTQVVAKVVFDTSRGVVSQEVTAFGLSQGYALNATGFDIEFHGGPGAK